MQCIVTGAAGFVGSSLTDRLLADGHSVIGVDCFLDYYPRAIKEGNISKAREHPKFTFVEGNLLSLDLPKLVSGVEWVFHQAGQAGVRASWGDYFKTYSDNNVLATQKLLEALKPSKALKKLVFASSSSVYGNAESFPTSEKNTPQPVSPYGVTKLASEHLTTLYATQFSLPAVSLRYFTVYGPRQRPDMSFNRLIAAGLKKEKFVLYGDGEQTRDFTYIDDIVEANILAAKHGVASHVYNLGGGSRVTMNQVIQIVESYVGQLILERVAAQAGDARHTSADTTLARTEIGFMPKVSLQEGIGYEVQWMKGVM